MQLVKACLFQLERQRQILVDERLYVVSWVISKFKVFSYGSSVRAGVLSPQIYPAQ